MKLPEFERQLAVFKTHLQTAYAQGFDDAAVSILRGAQAHAMNQPQPQAPMPRPDAVPQRQFSPRGWTKAEDDVLRGAWARINFERLSQHFGRSARACRLRGKVLGLCRIPVNHRYPEGEEL
jgi:hypothetical protein